MALSPHLMELVRKAQAAYCGDTGDCETEILEVSAADGDEDASLNVADVPAEVLWAFNDMHDHSRQTSPVERIVDEEPRRTTTTLYYNNPDDAAEALGCKKLANHELAPDITGQAALQEMIDCSLVDLDDLGVAISMCVNTQEMRIVAGRVLQLAWGLFALAEVDAANVAKAKPRFRVPARTRSGSVVPFVRPI